MLDRVAERRADEAWLAAQAADPAARAVVVGTDGVRVRGDRLALVPLGDAPGALLLGRDARGPVFAVDADSGARRLVGARGEGPERGGIRAVGLRVAAASLPHADAGLAAHAAALVNWHRRHRHCAVCGAPTAVAGGGIVRRCGDCGAEHYPRTDPVAIMVVNDGAERVLLGRQAEWPAGRYSALAGFVEPGESLEDTVVREVREEAGVEVGPPLYVASQPWPFPSSLMLGFIAPWRAGEPRRIDDELEDVRWFGRADVAAAVAGREDALGLPPRYAIARRLLEHWLEGSGAAARDGVA